MAYYLVSYDLRKEKDAAGYEEIYKRLRSFTDWAWPLESVWIVESTSSSTVYDKIASAFDQNDGLLVAELTSSMCFDRPREGTEDWLKGRFTCR